MKEREEQTGTKTQDLDMIPGFWCCKSEQRGREEHGFVIGVGDQKAYAFVAEMGG